MALSNRFPGPGTHGNSQGPDEADGVRAAPAAAGQDDDVALMRGVLPVGQQQALHLRVLAARPEGRKQER